MQKNKQLINPGLDLLRGIVGFMVVLQHSFIFTDSHLPKLRIVGVINNCSLDIFFVLSGFLIASNLKKFACFETNSEQLVWIKKFFRNRLLKTIPPYFALIIICIILSKVGIYQAQDYDFSFFIFSQNLFTSEFWFLPHSYSLGVEFWFYIILPILLFLFLVKNNKISGFLLSSILIILIVLVYRYLNHIKGIENWDGQVRKALFSRIDGPFYGVILFYMSQRWQTILEKYKSQILISGLILFIICTYLLKSHNFFMFKNVFYFTVYPFSMLTVLNFFSNVKVPDRFHSSLRSKSVEGYALYLVHLPVLFILSDSIIASNKFLAILYLIFGIVLSYLVAKLFYFLFEKPFEKFRV